LLALRAPVRPDRRPTLPDTAAGLLSQRHGFGGCRGRRCGPELQTYQVAGDWRLYLEALSIPGARIAYQRTPLNIHRRHSRSITHALEADRHIDEIRRCHAAARRRFGLEDVEDRQSAYLAEIRPMLSAAEIGGGA